MDSFRTVLPKLEIPHKTGHNDRLMLVGSCFTEHIGKRLEERKFQTLINPFGIVYNPISMVRCLERLSADNQWFKGDELIENAGLWHSWEHHGLYSKPSPTETLAAINAAYDKGSTQLKNANRLLLTLGTAEVFCLLDNGQIIANNHKMPSSMFVQKRLSVEEVSKALAGIIRKLTVVNPDLEFILSVSPVRHLRNGLLENQRSKAVLLLAVEALCEQFQNVHYFPAYELLLDDLRDYRFYAADMLHPSDVAVDYIWQYFAEMFFTTETRQLNTAIEKILTAAKHRPFNPNTAEHRAFQAAQLEAIGKLKKEWPGLDFSAEEAVFRQ